MKQAVAHLEPFLEAQPRDELGFLYGDHHAIRRAGQVGVAFDRHVEATRCGVATEMQRRGIQLPLLTGGATTRNVHTSVSGRPLLPNPARPFAPRTPRAPLG